jgi:hypothetical protein
MVRRAGVALALACTLAGCAAAPPAEPDADVDALFEGGAVQWTVRIDEPTDALSPCWADEPLAEARPGGDEVQYLDVVLTPPAGQTEADGIRDCIAELSDSTVAVLAPTG